MNFEKHKIVTIKLNSGEELIAKILEDSLLEVTLSDPMSVAPGPQGVGLIPSIFTSSPGTPVIVSKASIAMQTAPDPAIASKYTEATTGIIVPDKKLILG